jgi:RND family efflux transporter MFP subunit
MKGLFALVVSGAIIFSALGCSPGATQVSASPTKENRPLKATSPPQAKQATASKEIVVSGPVTVEQQLDIVALRAGVIVALPLDVDSVVKKDQVMARLDARQLEADRSNAAHKVESLNADTKNWESELQVREADMRRAEAMHKEGINTQEAYDHAKYEVTASQYEVERQRGEMLSAEANVQSIDLELEKTKLVAPFNGVVSQRYVRLGQYVTAGEKLFRLIGTSPLEVQFTLPAADIARLKRGDRVTVSATPEFQQTAIAVVTQISPVIDPGSGMIEITAVMQAKSVGLIPGAIASIRITSAK